jgi:hypothetical protein
MEKAAKAEHCGMCDLCHVSCGAFGGSMILAPHIVLCALRTVTYAHGAGKVVFFRTTDSTGYRAEAVCTHPG